MVIACQGTFWARDCTFYFSFYDKSSMFLEQLQTMTAVRQCFETDNISGLVPLKVGLGGTFLLNPDTQSNTSFLFGVLLCLQYHSAPPMKNEFLQLNSISWFKRTDTGHLTGYRVVSSEDIQGQESMGFAWREWSPWPEILISWHYLGSLAVVTISDHWISILLKQLLTNDTKESSHIFLSMLFINITSVS